MALIPVLPGGFVNVPSGSELPPQSGHAGEYLTTDGTAASWAVLSGGGDVVASGTLSNDSIALGAGGTSVKTGTTGTGVVTALGVNTGSAGAFVVNGGALGTPSSGNGSNLTSLNASNLGSGTVPDARFPATLPASSGANLTNLNASNLSSGTVPDARFPATLPAVSGANLTSLNASNLASGTVATPRLGTGTADNTTFLRGDGTWATPAGSGNVSAGGTLTNNNLVIGQGTTAVATVATGTGVLTALGVNVGSAGALIDNGGDLGTPSGGVLTNCTGLPINTGLIIASQAQGDILYYNGTNWTRLAAGTNGHYLQTQGAGANPQWASAGSGGGATNIYTAASSMTPNVTTGAAVGLTETATNDINYSTLDFDATADEFAQFWLTMPNNWNAGTVTVKFHWTAASGSGDVVWGIQARSFANDDALDSAFGTAQTVTDTLTSTNDMCITSATSAMTIGGTLANGNPIIFQVYRDANAGGDTLNADAQLIGIEIAFN